MMRPRRGDAGISMILVIVLVLIAIILVVASIILYAGYAEKERQKAALKKESERLNLEDVALRQEVQNIAPVVGLPADVEGELPAGKAQALVKTKRDLYFTPARAEELPTVGAKPLPPEIRTGFEKRRDETALYSTLQELVKQAAWWTQHYRSRMEQLTLEKTTAKGQADNRESIRPGLFKQKEDRIKQLQERINEVNSQASTEMAAYTERKAKLTAERDKAEEEINGENGEKKKFEQEAIRYGNEISKLRQDLDDLKTKEIIHHDITVVHGKILRPDVPNKIAFLDIGSRERVVPGLKFLVGKYGLQGRFEYKGKVEVKKAWTTHSEVSVIEVFDAEDRPIVDGDLIVNPLFSTKRPVVVAFAGEERPIRLRYSVHEASNRIREIGSEVRKEVTLDVDFVIFTEVASQKPADSYDPYKKAVFLEIPVAYAGRTQEDPNRPGIFDFLGD